MRMHIVRITKYCIVFVKVKRKIEKCNFYKRSNLTEIKTFIKSYKTIRFQ